MCIEAIYEAKDWALFRKGLPLLQDKEVFFSLTLSFLLKILKDRIWDSLPHIVSLTDYDESNGKLQFMEKMLIKHVIWKPIKTDRIIC